MSSPPPRTVTISGRRPRRKHTMTTITALRRRFLGRAMAPPASLRETVAEAEGTADVTPVDIGPNDPLLAYLQSASGVVDV